MSDEPRRFDEPERLSRDQASELQAQLSEIGPWVYMIGTGGIHGAERLGTQRLAQAALTAGGLLEAVRDAEIRHQQSEPTSVVDGLRST